jgi:ribonuclease R
MNQMSNLADMAELILSLIKSDGYVPMDMRDMGEVLNLEPEKFDLFAEAIETLEKTGVITHTKRGKIIKIEDSNRINGIFHATSRGFGFVTPDNKAGQSENEIFIAKENSLGAMNGDRVQVRRLTSRSGDTPEGEIVLIIQHAISEVIGTFREIVERPLKSKKNRKKLPRRAEIKRFIVKPDDPKLNFKVNIPPSVKNSAEDGDKVLVRITKYPHSSGAKSRDVDNATGKVLRIFGESDTKNANYLSILYENGIRTKFGDDVLTEAKKVASLPITAAGRLDLRDKIIFTIDGPDAKDFDDAISIDRDGDGYLLGVHIADVSHYVRPGSALDQEALARGTSLYFIDKVVPMLPEELSNGVCSLNRDTDKYTLSALIKLDSDGNILDISLHESIISSKLRGVYPELNDVIEKHEDSEFWEKYAFLFPDTLPVMLELYEKLYNKYVSRGALELETVESVFVLNDEGMPVDIVKRERGVSERLIEQFMLCANEAVATWLTNKGMPCVYRIHEEPTEEKVQAFSIFAHNIGLNTTPLRRKKIHPGAYQQVYLEAKEKGIETILTVVMLRSLMKAKYSSAPTPHFGLGCDLYCHFTSPIRRYPDLAVHRIIRAILSGNVNINALSAFADEAAIKSSENELRALNAERDIEDLYKVIFLSDKIGEEFDGVISSVTSFGLFVELSNTCEGLVQISEMDGYFDFDERALTLTCGRLVYRLGDKVRVRLTECDIVTRKINFILV